MSSGRSRSGGTCSAHDREPEVEVRAEGAAVDLLAQVAVGGGDDAHVDLRGCVGADAAHLARLEHAQQLRLQRQRQLADLVEEQRAAVGLLERAGARRSAPVNAPFSWPNSSASIRLGGMAPQSTTTSGPAARVLAWWIASASASLPVPVSPWISTVTSEAATRPATANRRRIAVDRPHSRPKRSESASGICTDSSSCSKRTWV